VSNSRIPIDNLKTAVDGIELANEPGVGRKTRMEFYAEAQARALVDIARSLRTIADLYDFQMNGPR
jgi:hypothetical protein